MKKVIILLLFIIVMSACSSLKEKESPKGIVISDESKNYDLSIYLPKSYKESVDRFPVVYMLNVSNVLEDFGWGVNKTMDRLINENKINESIIVVFSPKDDVDLTEDDITKNLVSFIDGKYKTIKNRESRALMSGSYGGGFSIKTAYKYPDFFSFAGALSFHPHIGNVEFLRKKEKENIRIWISEGTRENGSDYYLKFGRTIFDILKNKGYQNGRDLFYYEDIGGVHGGDSWGDVVINPLILFLNNKNYEIDKLQIEYEFLDGASQSAYINPIIKLKNGVSYSDLDAQLNLDKKSKAKLDKDNFIKFEEEDSFTITYEKKDFSVKKTIEYKEIYLNSNSNNLNIHSKDFEKKSFNLENLDFKYINAIHCIRLDDAQRLFKLFKKESDLLIKYKDFVIIERGKKYIPISFINREFGYNKTFYKSNVLFFSDNDILKKILRSELLSDSIGMNIEINNIKMKKFNLSYLCQVLKDSDKFDEIKIDRLKEKYLKLISKEQEWNFYYDKINEFLDEVSKDIYILKYGNPYSPEKHIYNLFKFEDENVYFLINNQKLNKISEFEFNENFNTKEYLEKSIDDIVEITEEDAEQSKINIETENELFQGGMNEILRKYDQTKIIYILADNSILIL